MDINKSVLGSIAMEEFRHCKQKKKPNFKDKL